MVIKVWRRLKFFGVIAVFALIACAAAPKQVIHGFSFDDRLDGWQRDVDLLEYSYGNQYSMVHEKVRPGGASLAFNNVYGRMPVGDFLYAKWRLKETGEIFEQRVNLKNKLPIDIANNVITFSIDRNQLFVYLITPQDRASLVPTTFKSYLAKYKVAVEIYPADNFAPR